MLQLVFLQDSATLLGVGLRLRLIFWFALGNLLEIVTIQKIFLQYGPDQRCSPRPCEGYRAVCQWITCSEAIVSSTMTFVVSFSSSLFYVIFCFFPMYQWVLFQRNQFREKFFILIFKKFGRFRILQLNIFWSSFWL